MNEKMKICATDHNPMRNSRIRAGADSPFAPPVGIVCYGTVSLLFGVPTISKRSIRELKKDEKSPGVQGTIKIPCIP
jgi:hypothetical protein